MVYECEQCGAALPAGVVACPRCGDSFDDAVPEDAEVPITASVPDPKLEEIITADTSSAAAASAPPRPRSARGPRRLLLALVLLAAVVIGTLYFLHIRAQTSSASSVSGTAADIAIGDDAILTVSGPNNAATDVLAGTTEQAEVDMSDAASANDMAAYTKVAKQGRAFAVPAKTHALLVGYGTSIFGDAICQVRIEGGPHDGQLGWVPREWLIKP